ncbi:AMP-binding protein [Brevibacterium jeotgali]|uniref:Fatty-acyl-CoA synthase n=1 Tax=Brevibacterium jeotgali TaxID=1262550 RepID=A0A2H1L5X6_9MICO|nr:AMP-binding protein [Brevibacterium jeotgali]TWB98863.1 fatty-acyl-CoA synthase [Brevibacterium jeotgali]SMY12307.1 fatty-acyl-CoA synthase [Brevibacterium jeotgali]
MTAGDTTREAAQADRTHAAGGPAAHSPLTWHGLLEHNARTAPHDEALIDGERTLTHAQLLARVRSLTGGFADLGVQPGQIVAVWLPNRIEWVETAAALAALGATALGINTKLRSHDVRGLLARADCDLVVTDPGFRGIDFRGMLSEIHEEDPAAIRLVVEVPRPSGDASAPEAVSPTAALAPAGTGAEPAPFATVDYGRLLEADPRDPVTHDANSPASAFTSSGSTGVPKIIMHTQAGLIGHSTAVARAFGYTDASTVVLATLPLCGVFGLNTLMAALCAGRPAVLQAAFDPHQTIDLVERHRITHTNMADAMLAMLLDAAEDPARISTLREVGFGNFTATDVRGIISRGAELGKRFFQTYGSSEVQALMCYPPVGADPERLSQGGGVPVSPLIGVRVAPDTSAAPGSQPAEGTGADPTGGRLRSPADHPLTGEIEIRGPFVSPGRITEHGYEDTPVDEDGWFGTGDLGYMRTEDDVVYLNRMGDVLRLGGFLVAPREVEDLLIDLPGISEAQFVAVPGPRGLVPVAFVILDPAAGAVFDEDAVLADCRAVLAGFKVPRRVVPLQEFPTVRGANGDKIQRNRLREMAEDVLAAH